jgi:hypothetical protein
MSINKNKKYDSDVEIISESGSDSEIESKDSLFDDDSSDISSCSLLKFTINKNFYNKEKSTKKKESSESSEDSKSSDSYKSSESGKSSESSEDSDSSDSYKSSESGYSSDSDKSSESGYSSSFSDTEDSEVKLSIKDLIDKKKGGDNTIYDNSIEDLLNLVK